MEAGQTWTVFIADSWMTFCIFFVAWTPPNSPIVLDAFSVLLDLPKRHVVSGSFILLLKAS